MLALIGRWLTAVWFVLTAKCERTTRIVSDELDGRVSTKERLAARLHQVVCPGCRHASRQLRAIDRVIRSGSPYGVADPPPPLSGASRERIRDALRRAREETG